MADESGGKPKEGALIGPAIWAPAAVGVLAIVYGMFFMGDDQKESLMALMVEKGIPMECFESNPPTSGCVLAVVPWVIGLLFVMLVAYIVKTLFLDEPDEQSLETIKKESGKRHEVLQELLKELEDSKEDVLTEKDIGMLKHKMVWSRMIDLLELPNREQETRDEGFRWAFLLYEKELRILIEKTKEGTDVKYASGEKLSDHVDRYQGLFVRARQEGYVVDKELAARCYSMKWEAYKFLKVMDFKNVVKAAKMVLFAREAFPWVLLQTVFNTVTAVVAASKYHYRAEILESLSDPSGAAFWEASKALVLVELLSTVLGLITDTIQLKANALAQIESEVAFFNALLKMPPTWWALQSELEWWSDEKVGFGDVWSFGDKVSSFLEIPQTVLKDLTTAFTVGYLIIQKSSRSLVFLVGVNFASGAIFWVLGHITGYLHRLSEKGLIYPSNDDWSFEYALEPSYINTFLSFVRGPIEIKRYENTKRSYAESGKRSNMVSVFNRPVSAVISQCSEVMQFSTARSNVTQGIMNIPEADAMVKQADEFVDSTRTVAGVFSDVVSKASPLAKAYDLITLPKKIDPDVGLWPKEKTKGKIQFRNVRFSYPRRKAEVLKGVTFDVEPGETIGMTGSAGCGKSTCMRLLERFYDVTDGSILLDGIDIREYNPRWLRSQIATVAQEPVLLPMTIRENLTFGCATEPTLEEIYDACKAANIYDSLMDPDKFPSGLRTQIESAGNVSGGEKQRIAIARAILADPPILLLDEATSALDEENQEKVQEALNKLMEGRTTLVIAHRLSTIKNSSKIVAFDKGKVFEEGKHDVLLEKEGSLYRKLWTKQCSKKYDSDDEEEEGEENGDEEEVEEEEEVEPLEVEVGMSPPVSGLTQLEKIIGNLEDSDPMKKKLQRAYKKLEEEKRGRTVRQRHIQRGAVQKWQDLMSDSELPATTKNKKFKNLAKKVLIKNLHSSITKKLSQSEEEK